MMDGGHPDQLDLLAFVEEELPDARKEAVSAHLAVCEACADAVVRLETARHALRSAPMLELPQERRAAVLSGLPAQPARRRLGWWPRAVVPALATAAVASLVAVALLGDFEGGDDEQGAAGVPTAEMADEGAGAEASAPESDRAETAQALSGNEVRSVAGPPGEVARLLRRRGFDATVASGGAVAVRDAELEAVRRALVGRPAGPVPVVIP